MNETKLKMSHHVRILCPITGRIGQRSIGSVQESSASCRTTRWRWSPKNQSQKRIDGETWHLVVWQFKKKRKLKGKNGRPWSSFSQKSPVKSAGQMQRNWRLGPTVAQVAPLRQGELLQGSTGIWHNWPKNRQNVSPAGIATLLSGGCSRKLQRCHLVRGVIWLKCVARLFTVQWNKLTHHSIALKNLYL